MRAEFSITQFVAESVFGEGLQRHRVVSSRLGFVCRTARQALLSYVSHGPSRTANLDYLALIRNRRQVIEISGASRPLMIEVTAWPHFGPSGDFAPASPRRPLFRFRLVFGS
jgi:hypothetical protein